ncbi:hypothetical protein N0V88_005361 [Collariella sp. IMI 366227]|nr:hypothetical protein N0V88_005361 [Collariella sp. IMI 366227]
MTYQPACPPALEYGIDDEDENNRWKLSIRIANLFRLALVPLTLTTIIIWSLNGVLPAHNGGYWVAYMFLYFVLLWNIYLLLLQNLNCRRKGWLSWLPIVVCKIGVLSCAFNGNDEEYELLRKPSRFAGKTWARRLIVLTTALDMGFAFTIIGINAHPWPLAPWWYQTGRDVTIVLSSIVAAFEIVAGILTLADWNSEQILELGIVYRHYSDSDRHARIRLPSDADDRRTAAGTVAVSV